MVAFSVSDTEEFRLTSTLLCSRLSAGGRFDEPHTGHGARTAINREIARLLEVKHPRERGGSGQLFHPIYRLIRCPVRYRPRFQTSTVHPQLSLPRSTAKRCFNEGLRASHRRRSSTAKRSLLIAEDDRFWRVRCKSHGTDSNVCWPGRPGAWGWSANFSRTPLFWISAYRTLTVAAAGPSEI